MSKVAAPARRKDGREDEVNSAGVATAEHVRGSLGLGSDAAATSLYALQQVLQRDDADATAAALGRLAQNAAKKDEQALEVLDGWVRSSPRLAELFRAHAQCKTDTHLVAMFWCLRQALPRIRDDGAALEVWRRAANDWNVIRSLRRTSVCHAALEAVETAIVRVGAAAARWTVRALGADDVWQQMRQHQRNNRGGKEPTKGATTRQRCVSLASTIMRFGDTETRIAAMETGGVAASLLAKLGDDAPLRAHSLLKALRVHGVEAGDARLRSAAVSALAHEDAAAALRQVAAPRADRASDRGARQAQGEAIACLVGAAFAATDRAELVGLLRALDCCEARQRGALLTALGADGSLLPDWLRAATRGALTAVRPWDASPDAEPARRAVAGVEVLCSALGAAKHATVDYASLQSAQVAEAIVASCLPPEDVLAKKELSRGILHSSPAVKHATLQLVISILERFSIERRAAWTARGAAFCNAPDLAAAVVRRRPPPIKVLVASLLESTLVAEDSAPAAEDSAVVEPAAKRLRSDAGAAEDEDAAARAALRARLPEVQTLLTLVPKKKAVSDDAAAEDDGEADQTLSLFLAALRRYERDLPDAVADAHYDVLKLVPDVVKHWPACASQLFGVVNHAAALDHAGETVSGRLVRGRDAAAKAARATVLKAAAEPGDDAARAKACFAEALGRVGVRRGEADAWLGALRDGDDVDAFEACCVGPANADNTAPAAMIRAWLRDAHAAAPADGHVSWLLRESFRLAAERPAFATGVVHTVVVQLVSTSSNALDFAKALLREEGVLGAVAEFCRLVVADLDASTTEYDGGDEACTLRAGDVAAALIESVGVPMGVRGKRQRAGLWRCAERTDAPNLAAVAEALVQVPVPVALAHLAATIDRRNGRRLAASPWGQAVLERVVESVISGGELRSLVDALRALKFAGDRCAASPSEMAYLLGLQVRVAAAAINATKGAKSVVAAVDAALCAPSPPLWAAALAQKGAPLRSHLAAAAHLVASHLPPHRASTGLAAEALCTKLVVAAVQQRDAVGVVQRFAALASGGALEAALAACSADDAALLKALVVACFEDRRYDDADELLARPKVVAKAMGLWAASEDAQLDDVAARMARLQQRAPSVAACVPSARAQEWMRVAWARAAASDGAACGAAARVAEALARADAGCRAVACDGLAALVARLAPAKVNALAAAVAGVECCVLALAEGASDADPPGLRATALPWAAVALASQGRDAAATAVSRACGGVDFGAGAAVDFAVLSALSRASMPCQAALLACLEGHALSARAHEQAAALACDAILDGASPAEKMRAAVELLEDHADQLDQSDAMRRGSLVRLAAPQCTVLGSCEPSSRTTVSRTTATTPRRRPRARSACARRSSPRIRCRRRNSATASSTRRGSSERRGRPTARRGCARWSSSSWWAATTRGFCGWRSPATARR
ncbi:hypothetical protein M885DRAFT_329642 [Pelagophyceae sp. CCMP2097]|nr:hypothetical protein M885DRAFT_329642 [Pelagophyceae sp. CCMP2097]